MTISTPSKAPKQATAPVKTTVDPSITPSADAYPDAASKAKDPSKVRPVSEVLDDTKTAPVTAAAAAAVAAVITKPKGIREPSNGKIYMGTPGKTLKMRDVGVNRHLIIIARPGGCTEAEGRCVNPKGPDASAGFGPYIASLTGVSLIVKDGRYQVALNDHGTLVADEDERLRVWNILGGQDYLDQTVTFIQRIYPDFKLS